MDIVASRRRLPGDGVRRSLAAATVAGWHDIQLAALYWAQPLFRPLLHAGPANRIAQLVIVRRVGQQVLVAHLLHVARDRARIRAIWIDAPDTLAHLDAFAHKRREITTHLAVQTARDGAYRDGCVWVSA